MRLFRPQLQLRPLPAPADGPGAELAGGQESGADRAVAWLISTPFLAAILVVLTWPIVSPLPTSGPDGSWQAGLYMAVEGGLQFGNEFVFTYGPLGFLHAPSLFGEGLWLLAFGYHAAVYVALVASLVWTARRALPLPLALAACFGLLVVGHLESAVVLLAFVWAFVALWDEPPRFVTPLLVYGGGLLAALELLGKLNYGATVLVLVLVALAAGRQWRTAVARFLAVCVASLLAFWLLSGQDLANLPAYVQNSVPAITGYSAAMAANFGAVPWELELALATVALVLAGVVWSTRGSAVRLRIAAPLLFLLFAYMCFKQDFVRAGVDGRVDFALMMIAAALAVGTRLGVSGQRRLARWAPVLVLVPAAFALLAWTYPAVPLADAIDPGTHVKYFRSDLETLASPSRRADLEAEARASMRAEYGIPASILRRIGDRPVAVEPWEASAAWAYRLNWRPLPVIQDYAAYEPRLDRLDVAALEGDGPALVLRQNTHAAATTQVLRAINGSYPAWDAPAAKLALLCNYSDAGSGAGWELVERVPSRCGPLTRIGAVSGETGTPISVPRPPRHDEVVFAEVHGLGPNAAEVALSLLYRGRPRTVSFDDGPTWSFPAATAGDGLVLSVPAAIDFPRPFQLAPSPRRFVLGIEGAGPRPLEVDFFSRRVKMENTTRPAK